MTLGEFDSARKRHFFNILRRGRRRSSAIIVLMTLSIVLMAVAFALIYYPAFNRLARGIASHYSRADLRKRISAAMLDVLIVFTTWMFYRRTGSLVYIFGGGVYVLLRDAVAGRSVGKFCFGLVVMDLTTGRPCGRTHSAIRNVVFLVPGANLVALFLEVSSMARDRQGQRLGDRLAQTQVVEGFGARELAADLLVWWRDFAGNLDGTPRRRRKVPVRRQAA